jgi:hypothetical protein
VSCFLSLFFYDGRPPGDASSRLVSTTRQRIPPRIVAVYDGQMEQSIIRLFRNR